MQVDHDDPEDKSLLALNALWESHYRPHSLLVFSTGRSPESYALLRESKPLPTPDILITSVGTEIFHGDSMLSDSGWDELLSRGWDRNVVVQQTSRFPELVPQVLYLSVSYNVGIGALKLFSYKNMLESTHFPLTFSARNGSTPLQG